MNDKTNNKQIICFIILILLLLIMVTIGMFYTAINFPKITEYILVKDTLNGFFSSLNVESSAQTTLVDNGKIIIDGKDIDLSEVLKRNGVNSEIFTAVTVQDGRVYLVYQTRLPSKHEQKSNWYIAAYEVRTDFFHILYNGEFQSVKSFMQDTDVTCSERSVFFADDNIVLNDLEKVIVYNVTQNIHAEYNYDEYLFPDRDLEYEIIDNHQAIIIRYQKQEKIFTVSDLKDQGGAATEIYRLNDQKRLGGGSYLEYFFDSIQIVNNDIYFVCRVLNEWGETYAVILSYDFDTNSCKYVNYRFTWDNIGSGFYLVYYESTANVTGDG